MSFRPESSSGYFSARSIAVAAAFAGAAFPGAAFAGAAFGAAAVDAFAAGCAAAGPAVHASSSSPASRQHVLG
jgi:hypothetical protein